MKSFNKTDTLIFTPLCVLCFRDQELVWALCVRLFVLRVSFFFLLVSGMGCDLLLWHSMDFSFFRFYTPPHVVAVYYDITLAVRVSECLFIRLLYARHYFRFRMITSKYQWIFTKLGICIDIVEIWFGIANGQISSILTELSARDTSGFSFPDDNFS